MKDPKRVAFDPFPYESFAIWTLTQMKRWGQIKGDVDYASVARQVYRATDGEDEALLRALVACVNGVSQGVQNTG